MKTLLTITLTVILAFLGAMFLGDTTPKQLGKPILNLNQPEVLVQFNSNFNKANTYKGLETLGMPYYYVNLDENINFKSKYKLKSLPTIIYFKRGVEVKRWEGNVMLKLDKSLNTFKLDLK